MKLITFRSSKGDCLLISGSGDNSADHHILFDGGMTTSFRDHVAPYLNSQIKQNDQQIDLLCVTHIDEDHIKGVLTLSELIADWRIHRYKEQEGDPTQEPSNPEPPEVAAIWHNSFAETYDLGSMVPRIEQALHNIEQMTVLYKEDPAFEPVHEKALSIKQGITLSQLLKPEQLDIPVNPQFDGKIIKCNQRFRHKNVVDVGSLEVTICGPFTADLRQLKEEWEAWEEQHATELSDFYANLNLTALRYPLSSNELRRLLTAGGSMGDRDDVTIPNLASIILLVEQNGHSILMTGDSHADDILKGLKKNRKLDDAGNFHVDVLKVQHHGAEANIDGDFCDRVTADHYVFCGNGTHHNPEVSVIELIYQHRQPFDRDFTFWFNANPDDDLTESQSVHMNALKNRLQELRDNDATNHFEFEFVGTDEDFIEIDLA